MREELDDALEAARPAPTQNHPQCEPNSSRELCRGGAKVGERVRFQAPGRTPLLQDLPN